MARGGLIHFVCSLCPSLCLQSEKSEKSDVQSELKKMVYKDGIFNVMDKTFSIAIDSRSRILKQCNWVALSIFFRKCKETPSKV